MKTMIAEEERRCVLLAWSAADIEKHADQASMVIPLAPEGYLAARRSCLAKVIDTDSIWGQPKILRMKYMSRHES
jgi:hypothetical protein